MAIYVFQDLKTFDDGELDLDSGDLEIAGVRQSQRQLMINILSTTRGQVAFEPSFGWGGDGYIGAPNGPITHTLMDRDIGMAFRLAQDVSAEDLDWKVSPVDIDDAAIFVVHRGVFVEPDGTQDTDPVVLGWKYPFMTGRLELDQET